MTAITNQRNNIFRKRRDKQIPTSVGGGVSAGGGSGVSNPVDLTGFVTVGDLAAYYTKVELDDGQLDTRYYTETESDARYYTKTQLNDGQLDTRYYTETESDGRYYTKTQLNDGQLDTRYYTEAEADARFVHLIGDETIAGIKTFTNGIKAYSAESTAENFSSGFAGHGWKVDHNNEATFDTLNVRGTMNVYELMIQQIRASNGSIWVSDAMRFEVDYGSDATTWKIGVDHDNGNRYTPFQAGDIIKAQKWTGKSIKSTILVVDSVDTTDEYVNCLKSLQVGADPEIGDDFVRIGSTTNAARRGALYMTASDSGNPYLDVVSGLSSTGGSLTTKARLGKLDGITDADAGLSGSQSNYYGLYSDNVHLKGHIYAPSGEIGGWKITTDGIERIDGNDYLYISNAEGVGTVNYGRGITMLKASGDNPEGSVKIVRLGQLTDLNTNYDMSSDYGFEIIKRTDTDTYKHLVRIGGSTALFAGWNIDSDAIYHGTKKTTDGFSTDGITLAADGSMHSENFFINADGEVRFRTNGSATYLNFYDNVMQMYDDSTLMFEVNTSTDTGKIGQTVGGSYIFTMTEVADLGIRASYYSGTGVRIEEGIVGGALGSGRAVFEWDGVDLQIGDDDNNTDIVVKGETTFNSDVYLNNQSYINDPHHGSISGAFADATMNINCNRSGYIMRLYNDGNSDNRSGIYMKLGADTPGTADNNYIYAVDGNGSLVGTLLNDSTGGFRIYNASDEYLKTDIKDLEESALDKILKVKARKFQWKKSKKAKLKVPDATGFIAQELMTEFPEAVKLDRESGLYMISETALIPHMFKAIQELKQKVEELKN